MNVSKRTESLCSRYEEGSSECNDIALSLIQTDVGISVADQKELVALNYLRLSCLKKHKLGSVWLGQVRSGHVRSGHLSFRSRFSMFPGFHDLFHRV